MQNLPFVLFVIAGLAPAHAQGPANDECTGALVVGNGASGPFDNFGASTSSPPWTCAGQFDVWFVYFAGGPGTLSVDTCGSSLDTVLEIFDGTGGCGALASAGCNDDACASGSSLSVPVNAGPYWFRVGGFGSGASGQGTFVLNVSGPAATAPVARNTMLGVGCGDRQASIYEVFDYTTVDLANSTLVWQLAGAGYAVTRSAGATLVPPTPSATPVVAVCQGQQLFALPTPLPVPGGTVNALNVRTDGTVELGGAAFPGVTGSPTAADLLAWPRSVFACAQNYFPAAGQGTFELVAGVAFATWSGVAAGGGAAYPTSTFQFQVDLATGEVRLAIQSLSVFGHPSFPTQPTCVVGYSPGGPSLDPGPRDLSALGSAVLGPDQPPLRVVGTSRPRLGTSWSLAVGDVPPTGVIGIDVFGASDPGITNLAAIGMPGCGLRAALDVAVAWSVSGPTHAYGLSVPNAAALVGQRFYTTSSVLTNPPWNAFGLITANGVEGLIGVL